MIRRESFGEGSLLTACCGGYTLRLVPEVGGMVTGLEKDGFRALNEPASFAALKGFPFVYGLPILFPPGRIDGGRFTAGGRSYRFPVNEPSRNNSLHGFLQSRPWQQESCEERDGKQTIVLRFDADRSTDFFSALPVTFVIREILELDADGLKQRIELTNTDRIPLPVGLGFHSAFRAEKGCQLKVPVGERVLLNDRLLAAGTRPLSEEEELLRTEGLDPMSRSMDDQFTARPVGGSRSAVLQYKDATVIYEADPFFRHWTVWNNEGRGGFVCVEPQNWRANAPNLDLPPAESGMTLLEPGKTLRVSTALRIETRVAEGGL